MEVRGIKMKGFLREKVRENEGKMDFLQQSFIQENNRISEFKRETTVKINQKISHLHKTSRITNFGNKTCFLKASKMI